MARCWGTMGVRPRSRAFRASSARGALPCFGALVLLARRCFFAGFDRAARGQEQAENDLLDVVQRRGLAVDLTAETRPLEAVREKARGLLGRQERAQLPC